MTPAPFAAALEPSLPRPRTAPDPARLLRPLDVTPRLRGPLAKLGLETVGDLLESLPFRHEDLSNVRGLAEVEEGELATVLGRIVRVRERGARRRNLRIVVADIEDRHGARAGLVWFNQAFLVRTLEPGSIVLARGDARRSTTGLELTVRTHELVATPAEAASGDVGEVSGLVPVYHASARISTRVLRRLAEQALAGAVEGVADPVPPSLRVARRLPLRRDALAAGHRPRRLPDVEAARRRLAYEELLLLQLALLAHRREVDVAAGAVPLASDGPLRSAFAGALPFGLTGAQRRALAEIDADLARAQPMQRLLQGDVGSGKTAVALASLLPALDAGGQAALMAPTEVLAVQHLATADRLVAPLGAEVLLLTGDVPAKERRARLARVEAGEPLLAVGTHAVLNARFGRLLAAVVDEQHRFGVGQRQALAAAEPVPHLLHMTATPIPRSLALTAFGDLDLSTLDELPAGRKPISTSVVPEDRRDRGYGWIVEQCQAGRQAYVVCALVEGSETIVARAAEEEAERLATGPLRELRVGCVHGRMDAAERARTMRAFVAGEVDVLVATTVIEVGVDVPNATIMVIEDADRFGLAQLHQLRGRVGRGSEQSYCFLFESAEPTPDGRDRLEALAEHASGFELAEIDLRMRGEGALLGEAQSGLSDLRFARLHRDRTLLERAREDAAALLAGAGDDVLAAAAEARFGETIAGMRRA